MLQLQEKHPVMVDLPTLRRESRGGTMSNWLGLLKFWGVYCCHCSRGFSVIKYMSMSVETLEKTKPWSRKMKSSPKMIRSMSWIKKSMSWIRKSSSTKSWKKRPCKILTPLAEKTPWDPQSVFIQKHGGLSARGARNKSLFEFNIFDLFFSTFPRGTLRAWLCCFSQN